MNNRLLKEQRLPSDGKAGRRKCVTVNEVESPLGWLRTRGHLSQRQFDAGERLREDWETSQLSPQVTMRWDPSPVSGGARGPQERLLGSERQMAARSRFDDAIAAAGPGLSDILWRIVCAGDRMREAETALGWPVRAGKLVLGLALDRVANFYRLR